jgi:hypothetical protein
MIETRTVLILGAGASIPYGYPSGSDLKNYIIGLLTNIQSHYSWIDKSNIPKEKIDNFIVKLERSDAPSIDIFLENQNNKTFTEIGKKAIVNVISDSENPYILANPTFNDGDNDHWYQYFGRKLLRGDIEEITSNISIVTFNYDRSLETYLIRALANNYGEIYDYSDSARVIDKIPIIHMYGELDPLPCQSKYGRDYGEECTVENIIKLSDNINLIHEAENLGTIDGANNFIEDSDRVYFLGLDLYNNQGNIDLLDLSSLKSKKVLATAYQLKTAERIMIKNYFIKKGCKQLNSFVGNFDQKSLVSIREYLPL